MEENIFFILTFLPFLHPANIYGAASTSKVPAGELKRCLRYCYIQQVCNLVNMYKTGSSIFFNDFMCGRLFSLCLSSLKSKSRLLFLWPTSLCSMDYSVH